jgi:hypothetical protein
MLKLTATATGDAFATALTSGPGPGGALLADRNRAFCMWVATRRRRRLPCSVQEEGFRSETRACKCVAVSADWQTDVKEANCSHDRRGHFKVVRPLLRRARLALLEFGPSMFLLFFPGGYLVLLAGLINHHWPPARAGSA